MYEIPSSTQDYKYIYITIWFFFVEADHAIRQFVFESLAITKAEDKTGLVQKPKGANPIPWDDPYPFYTCMIPEEPIVYSPPEVKERPGKDFWQS